MPGKTFCNLNPLFLMTAVILLFVGQIPAAEPSATSAYSIERTVMTSGYDGKKCWVHARTGIIPGDSVNATPTVVMTTQPLLTSGSDVFYALNSSFTKDLGKTWSPLVEQQHLRRKFVDDKIEEITADFTPSWHQKTGKLLGTGATVRYRGNEKAPVTKRFTAYSVYNASTQKWSDAKVLKMPDEKRFEVCGSGSGQRYDLPNGDILLPVYFRKSNKKQYSVAVCLCKFDGNELTYVKHGSEITVNVQKGLFEPSVTKFRNRYYLTLRNNKHGYVTSSADGLTYDEPRRWTFDDGSDLGNYNTQQHWLTHSDGLYLVYTRKGANNDHVFRHRAPLFIAQVDPEKLTIIRSTEQVVIPERGARLGNFGVASITADESWVVATEWMQTWGPNYIMPVDNKYGADNSIFIAKIKWTKPNQTKP